MWARVCQRSQLYVCDERKQFGEMNEVCVMACCSAMFIRQQCVCVCVCVCGVKSVFALLKHEFLGNSRRYGKCSLRCFPRFSCQHCQWNITDSNTRDRCRHCGGLPYICLARSTR